MHNLFMQGINTCMNTYTALIKAKIGSQIRAVPAEIRACSASDAKWLLQAIYGFHSLVSTPSKVKKGVTENSPQPPLTPEKARIQSLKSAKDKASDALKIERDRQKRAKAMQTLRTISNQKIFP